MRFTKLLTTASALALGATLMAGTASANNNQLVVEQVGNGNYNNAEQVGGGNETLVQQYGNRNTSAVPLQGAASFQNDIFVRQNTRGNLAEFGAYGGGVSGNVFGAVQSGGNYNVAAVQITPGSANNEIGVLQNGTQNEVSGGQPGGNADRGFGALTDNVGQLGLTMTLENINALPLSGDGAIDGSDNFAAFEQVGNFNRVGLSITGTNNTIFGQRAPGNYGGVDTMDFNALSSTTVFDGGTVIDAEARSGNRFPGGGVNTFVDSVTGGFAKQSGSNNQAALLQNGNDNIIAFGQIGSNNLAEISQVGNLNFHLGGQN